LVNIKAEYAEVMGAEVAVLHVILSRSLSPNSRSIFDHVTKELPRSSHRCQATPP